MFDTPADGAAGGVTETLVSSTVVTLAGSPAAINSYLDTTANLQYTPAADVNGTAAARLTIDANDGYVTRSLGTVSINVTAVDDPITLTGAPASVTVLEDTPTAIDLSDLLLDDPDEDLLTVIFTIDAGSFSVPPAGSSVTASRVSATEISLEGDADDINSYLDSSSLTYLTVADRSKRPDSDRHADRQPHAGDQRIRELGDGRGISACVRSAA